MSASPIPPALMPNGAIASGPLAVRDPFRERQYNEWCEMPLETLKMWNVVEEFSFAQNRKRAANSENRIRARIVQSACRVIEGHVSVCEPGILESPSVSPTAPVRIALLLRQ